MWWLKPISISAQHNKAQLRLFCIQWQPAAIGRITRAHLFHHTIVVENAKSQHTHISSTTSEAKCDKRIAIACYCVLATRSAHSALIPQSPANESAWCASLLLPGSHHASNYIQLRGKWLCWQRIWQVSASHTAVTRHTHIRSARIMANSTVFVPVFSLKTSFAIFHSTQQMTAIFPRLRSCRTQHSPTHTRDPLPHYEMHFVCDCNVERCMHGTMLKGVASCRESSRALRVWMCL